MITTKLKYVLIIILLPIFCQRQKVKSFQKVSNGINVALSDGTLGIYPLTENTVRIKFYNENEGNLPELIVTSTIPTPEFSVIDLPSQLKVATNSIRVVLDKQTSNLSFANQSGKIFLSEKVGARKFVSDLVQGEPCYFIEQSFESPVDEFIFSLGQFQDGHYNLKGITRRLTQVNSQIAIPFIYSNQGYGT